MIRKYIFLLIVLSGLIVLSCDTSDNISDPPFEFLVSERFSRTITQQQLEFFWSVAAPAEIYQSIQSFIAHDVDLYRVVYNTVDGDGRPIEASGAILVPKGVNEPGLISLQHATIFSNDEAPSVDVGISVAARKAIFASAGYITFLPDYLGYGITENLLHPYQQESTLASASYDMLQAGLEFVQSKNLTTTSQPVNLMGYSEGAYATLALARLIETTNSGIELGLLSMGAPIFDLSGTMDYIIENITDPMECVACYAYFLYTYHQIYDLPRPLSDYFNAPYDQIIGDGLFSGENSSAEVTSQLPENGADLFTESFIQRYLNGDESALTAAVAANNILFVPAAPVLLVHGDDDGVAPVFNSDDFESRALNNNKNNLTYLREEGVTHGTGIFPWGLETLESLGVKTKQLAGR
jgi:pimeloyl-ACP methyl ester carboxylesterase